MSLSEIALANKVVLDSTNVNEVHSRISRYFKSHDIRFLDGSADLHTILKRTQVNQLAVNVLEYGGNVMIDPGPLDSFYLLHINLRGQCEMTHDGGHMTIDENNAVICAPHRAHRFWWQPDSQVVAIQIPRDRLVSHVRQALGRPIADDIDFDIAIDLTSSDAQAFMGLVRYMLSDANLDDGLTNRNMTAEPLERALLSALLRMQPGSHQSAMLMDAAGAVPAHVRRAENYMHANINRAIRMSELADVAGVTDRTLSSSFQRFRGDSPASYFLNMRLSKARQMLLSAPSGKTVSDIAFDLGFGHLSGFAAAYRSRFDETPAQTLRSA